MNAKDAEDLLTEIYTWPEMAATSSRDFGRGYARAIRDVEEYLRGATPGPIIKKRFPDKL